MVPTRRVFLVPREVTGLLIGAVVGEPAALRRILGARRSGRTGAVLALAALLLASPSLAMVPPLIALHALLALHIVIRRSSVHLHASQALVLSLWTVAPALAALAPLKLIWSRSPWPALLALLLGHWLVWRAVRRGLS